MDQQPVSEADGVLVGMAIVKRERPRTQSANPDENLPSRNRLVEFDLVMIYEVPHG